MSGQNQYLKFCEKYYLQPFPTFESALTLFVAYLHQKALSPGTIKSYLAAIQYHQISQGLKDPNVSKMPRLEYIIKGIKRLSLHSTRCWLPITPPILIKLKEVWKADRDQFNASMLWAALCFFGFLQSGEVVAPSELEYDSQTHLCLGWTATNIHLAWK